MYSINRKYHIFLLVIYIDSINIIGNQAMRSSRGNIKIEGVGFDFKNSKNSGIITLI
jgi:hypothetical protein